MLRGSLAADRAGGIAELTGDLAHGQAGCPSARWCAAPPAVLPRQLHGTIRPGVDPLVVYTASTDEMFMLAGALVLWATPMTMTTARKT